MVYDPQEMARYAMEVIRQHDAQTRVSVPPAAEGILARMGEATLAGAAPAPAPMDRIRAEERGALAMDALRALGKMGQELTAGGPAREALANIAAVAGPKVAGGAAGFGESVVEGSADPLSLAIAAMKGVYNAPWGSVRPKGGASAAPGAAAPTSAAGGTAGETAIPATAEAFGVAPVATPGTAPSGASPGAPRAPIAALSPGGSSARGKQPDTLSEFDAATAKEREGLLKLQEKQTALAQEEARAKEEAIAAEQDAIEEYQFRKVGLEQRRKQELASLQQEDQETALDARYAGIDRATRKQLEQTLNSPDATPEQRKAAEAQLEKSRETDGGRWWATRTTGQTIAATLGILLSGIGDALTGKTGQNSAIEIIDRAISRDIEAQREKFQDKRQAARDIKSRYGELREKYGDEETALQAARVGGLDRAAAMLRAGLAKLGPQQQAVAAQDALRQLEARREEEKVKWHQMVLDKKEASGQWNEEMRFKWASLRQQAALAAGKDAGEAGSVAGMKMKPGAAALSPEEVKLWRARAAAHNAGKEFLSKLRSLRAGMPASDFVGGRLVSGKAQEREADARALGNDYINTIGRIYTATGAAMPEAEMDLLDPEGYLRNPGKIAIPGKVDAYFAARGKSLDSSFYNMARGMGFDVDSFLGAGNPAGASSGMDSIAREVK